MMTAIFINCDSARFYGSQPKDTARTLKIQRAAYCVSGDKSAHLAHIKSASVSAWRASGCVGEELTQG